jgi:hypothetical protein
MSHQDMVPDHIAADRPEALATGDAGTVYLCHPFLVHAAQRHQGTAPRCMAQPPLHPAEPIRLDRVDGDYSPVEIAIQQALQGEGLNEPTPTGPEASAQRPKIAINR